MVLYLLSYGPFAVLPLQDEILPFLILLLSQISYLFSKKSINF